MNSSQMNKKFMKKAEIFFSSKQIRRIDFK